MPHCTGGTAGSLLASHTAHIHCVFAAASFDIRAGANCVIHSARSYVTSFEHVPLRIDPLNSLPLHLPNTGHRQHNIFINHRQRNNS